MQRDIRATVAKPWSVQYVVFSISEPIPLTRTCHVMNSQSIPDVSPVRPSGSLCLSPFGTAPALPGAGGPPKGPDLAVSSLPAPCGAPAAYSAHIPAPHAHPGREMRGDMTIELVQSNHSQEKNVAQRLAVIHLQCLFSVNPRIQ